MSATPQPGAVLDLTPKKEGTLGEEIVEKVIQPRAGAEKVAYEMGLISAAQIMGDPQLIQRKKKVPGDPGPGGGVSTESEREVVVNQFLMPTIRGRKALVGQYVKDGVDQSEVINASVKGAIKLAVRKPVIETTKATDPIVEAMNEATATS